MRGDIHSGCHINVAQWFVVVPVVYASGWRASVSLTCLSDASMPAPGTVSLQLCRAECGQTNQDTIFFFWGGSGVAAVAMATQPSGVTTVEFPQNPFDQTWEAAQRETLFLHLSLGSVSLCCNSSHVCGFDAWFVSNTRRISCLGSKAINTQR